MDKLSSIYVLSATLDTGNEYIRTNTSIGLAPAGPGRFLRITGKTVYAETWRRMTSSSTETTDKTSLLFNKE